MDTVKVNAVNSVCRIYRNGFTQNKIDMWYNHKSIIPLNANKIQSKEGIYTIKSVKLINNKSVLANVITNTGEIKEISYSKFKKIWKYATCEELEWINITYGYRFVVCCLTTAQGQGGIVVVWDCEKNSIVHYQNGDYAIVAIKEEDKIITLHEVSNYVTKSNTFLSVCDFGVKNIESKGELFDLNISINSTELSSDNYKIIIGTDDIKVKLCNEIQVLTKKQLGLL